MAKWGKCDFDQLKKFQQELEKMSKVNIKKFCEDVSKEIASRLLSIAIKRTPIGKKPEITGARTQKVKGVSGKSKSFLTKEGETLQKYWSGYVGGTLRRGWTAKTEQEAESGNGKGEEVESWVNELLIKHIGNTYQIDVTNVVSYASYVEFGHRQQPGRYVPAIGKKLRRGWVDGKFMLTIAEQQINAMLPKFIETRIMQLLSEVL